MKFPFSWLKEFIDIQGAPAVVAKILTQLGIEVDSIETSALAFQNVIVGKVIEVQKHPTADRLQIATVSDGTEKYQVVCGAPNCRVGIKTAFAMIGATIKEESGKTFTIKKSRLRDVESFGMLCSAKELQIGSESDGIMEFAEHIVEGSSVAEMYADSIFEVSLTPNLGHALSLLGIARELSAASGLPVRHPKIAIQPLGDAIDGSIQVTVKAPDACPRYACRVIKGIKIGPSPEWMQKKLTDCGFRPVNNVVDATNYVLMELGQPLHAFDLRKIKGGKIIVRKASEKDHLITLDGKERILTESDLLICDESDAIALAGVMGGGNSEVDENTVDLLIESAYFNPSTIRRTAKRFGLQTEASKRFERSVDPNGVLEALDRVSLLIQETAGGAISTGLIDLKENDFSKAIIECRLSRINSLLGTRLGLSEVEPIFHRLKFKFEWDGADVFKVTPPTYRADINLEVDLIEEVARIYGYDNIPFRSPRYHASLLPHNQIFEFERIVRSHMLAMGLQEFLTCDLIGPSLLDVVQDQSIAKESVIKVLNPTSVEQSVLRTSLLPGLLQVVKYNIDHQNKDISGFEIGRVHYKLGDQYKEQPVLGIILSGKSAPHCWDSPAKDVDFYDLKGIVENLFKGLRITGAEFKANALSVFHTGRQSLISVGSLVVGSVGEVHPAIQRRLDVAERIYFAEFNLSDLFQVLSSEGDVEPLPLYPSSERDWTVTLQENVLIDQVLATFKLANSRLLESVALIGLYRSEKLGDNLKNVTFRFVYRDRKKTIAQETVDGEHSRLVEYAKKKLENI